jgi:hypothetical protein
MKHSGEPHRLGYRNFNVPKLSDHSFYISEGEGEGEGDGLLFTLTLKNLYDVSSFCAGGKQRDFSHEILEVS